MYFDFQKSLWIFLTWCIQISSQLECLKCTGPIKRLSQNSDQSCLDGTLEPVTCREIRNGTEIIPQQCISYIYQGGKRGKASLSITRDCVVVRAIQHDCDPPSTKIEINKHESFLCSYACYGNGCNRHSFEVIISNANRLLSRTFQLFKYLFLIFFGCKLFLF